MSSNYRSIEPALRRLENHVKDDPVSRDGDVGPGSLLNNEKGGCTPFHDPNDALNDISNDNAANDTRNNAANDTSNNAVNDTSNTQPRAWEQLPVHDGVGHLLDNPISINNTPPALPVPVDTYGLLDGMYALSNERPDVLLLVMQASLEAKGIDTEVVSAKHKIRCQFYTKGMVIKFAIRVFRLLAADHNDQDTVETFDANLLVSIQERTSEAWFWVCHRPFFQYLFNEELERGLFQASFRLRPAAQLKLHVARTKTCRGPRSDGWDDARDDVSVRSCFHDTVAPVLTFPQAQDQAQSPQYLGDQESHQRFVHIVHLALESPFYEIRIQVLQVLVAMTDTYPEMGRHVWGMGVCRCLAEVCDPEKHASALTLQTLTLCCKLMDNSLSEDGSWCDDVIPDHDVQEVCSAIISMCSRFSSQPVAASVHNRLRTPFHPSKRSRNLSELALRRESFRALRNLFRSSPRSREFLLNTGTIQRVCRDARQFHGTDPTLSEYLTKIQGFLPQRAELVGQRS